MVIVAGEIKWFKSEEVSDNPTNGGRASTTQVITAKKNNLFPDVSDADRVAGITRFRKFTARIENDNDETFFNTKVHFTTKTPSDNYMELLKATGYNRQSDIDGSERLYGIGSLGSDISAGATTFTVTLDSPIQNIFNESTSDNCIYISDGTNEEYFYGASASKAGSTVTITLAAGDAVLNNYTAANTVVASVAEFGDVKPEITNASVTSTNGHYDTSLITADSIGSVADTFTITYTSATTFDCSGALEGTIATNVNISADFSPSNVNKLNKPFFTYPAAGHSGTFAPGDTVIFTVVPAAVDVFFKEITPAGTDSYTGNNFFFRCTGESSN